MASLAPVCLGGFRPQAVAWARSVSRLAGDVEPNRWFLAGSAALALYLGHRSISALDLMSGTNRLTSPQRRDLLRHLQAVDEDLTVETARNGYLYCRSSPEPAGGSAEAEVWDRHGCGLKFYFYPYPVATVPCSALGDLAVVSPLDLGLMKLGAIISRGTKRDFVDLFLLCRQLPFDELLTKAPEVFPHVRDFPLQALKGLADLDLARHDPMPSLTHPFDRLTWPEIEAWLTDEIRRSARRYIGLATDRPVDRAGSKENEE